MREEVEMLSQPVECSPKEWRPTRNESLREYHVGIKFLSVGCIISVGCKEVPFTTIKEGMIALNEYVAKPYETRHIWEKVFSQEEEL